MRLSNIEAYRRTFSDFLSLCDKEAKSLWEKYSLGSQGIGVFDVGQWLVNYSHLKVVPEGKTLVYDPQQMLSDFASMRGIGPDDVTETEV